MYRASHAGLPRTVMFELTNGCDLKCRHCPFHGDGVQQSRPIGTMPEALWRAALDELASWGVRIVFQPWGMGEPLLAPQLWQVVAEAKRHPQLEVGFYTNGNQWQARDVEAAIRTGLDWVCFSIDGVRRDVFEHYRVGASLERVLGSLRALAAARREHGRGPRIRINMVRYPELEGHTQEFLAALRQDADSIMVSRFRRVGVRRFSPVELPRIPCYQLDTLMAMTWQGEIVQCCEDQQGQSPVGRYPEQSLLEIWRGQRLTALREAHRRGDYDASPLCADCDAWTGVYEHEREVDGVRIREKTAGTVYEFDHGGQETT